MMVKANSRLNIPRACKYYGQTLEELMILFDSFMSVFTYGIEVYRHVLIVENTSLRSINSVSELEIWLSLGIIARTISSLTRRIMERTITAEG